MEKQNQTLTEILDVLSGNWDDLKNQPAEQIKEKLKSCIFIKLEEHELVNKRGLVRTGVNILKYENDKKTNKLKSWEYNSLNEQEKKKLEDVYEKKIQEIEDFMKSFCCAAIKKHYGKSSPGVDIIEPIVENLGTENYFNGLPSFGTFWNNTIDSMIKPLYEYWLEEKRKKTQINFEKLKNNVIDGILTNEKINEWGNFFRDGEFIALSNFVYDFINEIENEMLQSTKVAFEALRDKINPKFYLMKITKEGSALAFNEFGDLYIFPHGSKVATLYSERYVKEFFSIKEQCPAAFPEFHPEEW